MKLNKCICIVAENYPTQEEPSFPFVQQLARGLADQNVEVLVIAPQSITNNIFYKKRKKQFKTIEKYKDGQITIYRPQYITFSSTKIQLLQRIAFFSMRKAIRRVIRKHKNIDLIYSYFWHIGLTVAKEFCKSNITLVVQASECDLTLQPFMEKRPIIDRIDKVICASRKNLDESVNRGLITKDNYRIVVNGFNPSIFFPMSQSEARRTLGIDQEQFVVLFVGGFITRKGILELSQALGRFEDVYSIFIGSGDIEPTCHHILIKQKVDHDHLALYYSAADVFVLPTKSEGCCNAIIEALACGVPVISSNKSFNDEILNNQCAIRINECDEEEIYNAIAQIKNDSKKKEAMSLAALEKSQELTIDNRIRKIMGFLNIVGIE